MECAAESYFQHSTTQYYGITSGGSTTAYHTTSTNYNGTMYLDDGESVNTANGVFVSTEQSSTDRSFTIEAMNEPEFQDQNCRITFVDGTTLDGTPDADLSEGGFGATSSEFSCTFQWQCRPCGSPPCA